MDKLGPDCKSNIDLGFKVKAIFILLLCVALAEAEDFTIAHWSDSHAARRTNYIGTVSNALAWLVTAKTNPEINLRGFILTGDNIQAYTNTGSGISVEDSIAGGQDFARQLANLVSNDIFVVLCDGNHDANPTNYAGAAVSPIIPELSHRTLYQDGTLNLGLLTNQTGFLTNYDSEFRTLTFTYTNQGIKLLFVTLSTATNYTVSAPYWGSNYWTNLIAQSTWATNIMLSLPDHNVIGLGHHWINGFNDLSFPDSPTVAGLGNYYASQPGPLPFTNGWMSCRNLLLCVGGHDRRGAKRHTVLRSQVGHYVDVCLFTLHNAPGASETTEPGHANFNLLTFRPDRGDVLYRTYNIDSDRFLTNGETELVWTGPGASYTNTIRHEWTHPLAVPHKTRAFRLQ